MTEGFRCFGQAVQTDVHSFLVLEMSCQNFDHGRAHNMRGCPLAVEASTEMPGCKPG